MRRLVVGIGGALALGVAVAVAGAVHAAPPATPEGVAAFAARDAEARWVAYRAAPEPLAAWVKFLAERKDFEVLEGIALTTRTLEALDALQTADAPGWIRCAVWRLASADSHALDAARKFLLDRRPGAVLEWLERHPTAARGPGQTLAQALRAMQPPPSREDASRYALPWEADVLLAPLVPPADVADLGAAPRAAPGTVYVHQVLRAVDAWAVSNLRGEPWTGRIAALVSHRDASIAGAAALACAYLPAAAVPGPRLAALVDDPNRPPALRSSAVVGLSFASTPEAYLFLCRVASEAAHVAWSAAVSRLGDVGDELAVHVLTELELAGDADALRDGTVAAIRARLGAEEPVAAAGRVETLLRRVAFAAARGDAGAPTLLVVATGAIRPRLAVPEVRAAVEALRDAAPAPDDALAARVAGMARDLGAADAPPPR